MPSKQSVEGYSILSQIFDYRNVLLKINNQSASFGYVFAKESVIRISNLITIPKFPNPLYRLILKGLNHYNYNLLYIIKIMIQLFYSVFMIANFQSILIPILKRINKK